MRIRVKDVVDLYAAGLSPAEIVEEMPDLELLDLKAALTYAQIGAMRRLRTGEPIILFRIPDQDMKKAKTTEVNGTGARSVVILNRRARHEYSIEDTFDAGIALAGTEVKSIRAGQALIQDAFCKVENNEIWLYNMHVNPFEHGSHWNVEPRRKRKLLLHRSEIDRIRGWMEQKGLALIPLKLYFQRGFAKLELGVGKGKKLYDKREDIAKRDVDRERLRELSGRE